jgi:hypothetical protein
MKTTWRTFWQLNDIVVLRDEVEIDRLHGDDIARVFVVHCGRGDTPGEIVQSVVELARDGGYALFGPLTGFAGRVNFERQPFWRERRCIYWIPARSAVLPWRLRLQAWRDEAGARAFRRVARDELAASVQRWPAERAQTWEERKRCRLERSRPFGHAHA